MEHRLYLAAFARSTCDAGFARLGFGFEADGSLRAPETDGELLVLDDRHPPSEKGMAQALALFHMCRTPLLCDLEQPFDRRFEALLTQLAADRLIVPPQYTAVPHAAVFLPPYQPVLPFSVWLEQNRRQYGQIVLDMQPIGCRLLPGQPPQRLTVQGRTGHFSPALCCQYRAESGGFFLFDSLESFRQRIDSARAPCIALATEYQTLMR